MIKRVFLIGLMSLMIPFGVTQTPSARADYNFGCERIGWGFLMSGYRTICDGPKRADGSWDRTRREWTPAGYVPLSCSRYSCFGGYYRNESTQRFETYPVRDDNVLPNEPGWLPPGTLLIH